jgi:hypothetical protein
MALQTNGFLNRRQMHLHFSAHGGDFGASNAEDYERDADMFLGGSSPLGSVMECLRSKGDRMRYDPTTQALGVIDARGVIRTYFKPIPCVTVPASVRPAMRRTGKCHKYATNLAYFQAECAKW